MMPSPGAACPVSGGMDQVIPVRARQSGRSGPDASPLVTTVRLIPVGSARFGTECLIQQRRDGRRRIARAEISRLMVYSVTRG